VTDFNITGRLAQFGRGGIMEDVSNRLMRDFATCLSSRLGEAPEPVAPSGAEVTAGDAPPEAVAAAAPSTPPPAPAAPPPPPAAAPVKGFSLVFSVLWERIKRLFKRLFGGGRS
jgi:hypothetical protein